MGEYLFAEMKQKDQFAIAKGCSNCTIVPSVNGLGRIFLAFAGNWRSKAGGTILSCVGKSGGCPCFKWYLNPLGCRYAL